MRSRVAVSGVLAGIAVFAWSSVSHMLLPLGESGISVLPDQEAVMSALSRDIQAPGLYIYPVELDSSKWDEAYRLHPHGILVFAPAGTPVAFGRRMAVELATSVVCGWLAAFLFSAALPVSGNWKGGALAGATLATFGSVAIDFSYWNWYDFPTAYLAAALADQAIGWALGGAILGWWLGRRS